MRGDDTEGTSIIEAMQESLCNSPTDRGLRAATKFVDEQQASCSALTDEVLHVAQVRTIGTQVIFYGLLIPDVDVETVKDTDRRVISHGDRYAALYEVLQKTDRLKANGLPPSIRP